MMGILYGDIHYGIKISKKIVVEGDIFLEPIYELIFDDDSREDILKKVEDIYSKLLNTYKYQYELLVDVFTTHNGIQCKKGWRTVTSEQMIHFISGMHKISRG